MDVDGYGDGCQGGYAGSAYGAAAGGCKDEYRTKTVGTAKLGYPVSLSVKAGDGDLPATTFEVVDISKEALDAKMFEVPAGYTEVKSYMELMGGR